MNNNVKPVNIPKTCLFCFFWQPEGKNRGIIRHGGKCKFKGIDMRMDDSCWAWRICSPNQLEKRKEAGLIEEVKHESS